MLDPIKRELLKFGILQKPSDQFIPRQIVNFVIHLRWHYQVLILSGGFLTGAIFSSTIIWTDFIVQFLNVHLLLFGGATAYNSYWDKDEGAVGGLKHPPPMKKWMWTASLILQFIGLGIALMAGVLFAGIYLLSILFFWLYSTPVFRWKGRPVLSLIAIGISTGTNSLLMGYLAAGNSALNSVTLMASVGVGLIILSMYPASQVFQIEEDARRGDVTFAVQFGFYGVMQFYRMAYAGGLLLLGLLLTSVEWWMGLLFIGIGLVTGLWVDWKLRKLSPDLDNYPNIMRIKYCTSLAFVSFITFLLVLRHGI